MTARVILPLLTLAVGGGLGFCFGHHRVPTEGAPAGTPPPIVSQPPAVSVASTDEVVIEVRVKAPRGDGAVFALNATRRGDLINTQTPLDVAIEGEGFYPVLLPDGSIGYTRDGAFRQSAEGVIVTSKGLPLSPQITVPQNTERITIGSDGTFSVAQVYSPDRQADVGQITLARFANPSWLKAGPLDVFLETPESGPPIRCIPGLNGSGIVRQGLREQHAEMNVRSLLELVRVVAKDSRVGVTVIER